MLPHPSKRQTLLFSATMTKSLIALQKAAMTDAHVFQVGGRAQERRGARWNTHTVKCCAAEHVWMTAPGPTHMCSRWAGGRAQGRAQHVNPVARAISDLLQQRYVSWMPAE